MIAREEPPTDVQTLLSQLTPQEKVSLLAGADEWQTEGIERLGIGSLKVTDGPAGARGRLFVDGPQAAFLPAPIMQAATWSKSDLKAIGQLLCSETKTKAAHVLAGPTMCCVRNPLGGRNFETFSEDPYLSGSLAIEYVGGIQETGEVVACAKHFVANEQEQDRFSIDAAIDEKALREIYLRPFEMLVKSVTPPGCLMTAYNSVNGLHMDFNRHIIDEVLRQEWNFQGLVMSDWGGTNSTVESVIAGCDLEMPGPPVRRGQKLLAALKTSNDPELEASIDRSCERLLSLAKQMRLLGLTPSEVRASRKMPERSATTPEDLRRLRESVANGHVLLKNDHGALPLNPEGLRGKRIAFIGPNASLCTAGGGGSASMNPQYQSHPLEAFQQLLKDLEIDAEVLHTEGAYSNKWLPVTSQEQWSAANAGSHDGKPSTMFKVDFFASPDFTGPIFETQYRNNSSIDLTDSGPISLREAGKPYSVRVTSHVTPTSSGRHHLSLTSVGHSRLFVDGQVVVNNYNWTERGEAFYAFSSVENCAPVQMNKGQEYEIVIEAATKGADSLAQLSAENPAHVWSMQPSVRLGYLEELPSNMVGDAVEIANSCDYTVLVIGLSDEWESEGYDRKTLALPGNQNELVTALLQQSKTPENLVIVNQSGSPVEMPWADQASTILQAWYGGQEAGNALADILLGQVGPSGRLPITWPRNYSDLGFERTLESWPGVDGKVLYEEGTAVGYRWYLENKAEPQWWFGHGLEYTTFETSIVQVHEDSAQKGWNITIGVKNTGQSPGQRVVQIYSWPSGCDAEKELRSFDKTAILAPGESQSLQLQVNARDMAHWQDGKWVLKSGEFVMGISESAGAVQSVSATVSLAQSMIWEP